MAKTNYQHIDEYHAAFSGEALQRMQKIRKMIRKLVPDVEECISYQIPCFKYKGYLIYYAAFDKHITLSHPFSQALLEHFKEQLKHYKVSKAAIQIPNKEPLPEKMIQDILLFRKKENETKVTK